MQKLQSEQQKMQQKLKFMDDNKAQMMQQQAQQKLQQMQAELQQEAMTAMRDDVKDLASEKGYDYVLDQNVLLAGGEDVTEELLEFIG